MAKQVKCSKEWIIRHDLEKSIDLSHLTRRFCSQVEGVRKLEWAMVFYTVNYNECNLFLSLLTDIAYEIINVNFEFSIEDCNAGLVIFKDMGYVMFSKPNQLSQVKLSKFQQKLSGHLKFILQLSYNDVVLICEVPKAKAEFPIEKKSVKDACSGTERRHYVDASCETDLTKLDLDVCDTEIRKAVSVIKPVLELAENFGQLLLEPRFSDLTISVKIGGPKEFRVHKGILSIRCPVLAAILFEQKVDKPEIEDFEADTVEQMVNFIYTGRVANLTPKIAQELLIAAHRYHLKTLKKMAENYLISILSPENDLKLLFLADEHLATDLYNEAVKYMATNLKKKKLDD